MFLNLQEKWIGKFLNKIKSLQLYVYILFGLFVILSAVVGASVYKYGDIVIEERNNKYWSHDGVAEFVNIPIKDGEILQRFTAGYNYLDQFILVFDNYSEEDESELCVKLEDTQGEEYYSWVGKIGDFGSETYWLVASVRTELIKGEEYLLRIYLDNPQSDITVRAVSKKDIHESVGGLTIAGEDIEENVIYFSQSYLENFSYSVLWSLILAITFVIFLCMVFGNKEIWLRIWRVVSVLLLLIISYYSIESLSGNLESVEVKYAFINCFIIFCIYLIVKSLLLRKAYYVIAAVALVAGLVNFYVLEFRGTEFLLADIKAFSTAMSVAGNYAFAKPPLVFTSILLFACLIFLQILADIKGNKTYKKTKLPGRLILLGSGAILLFVTGRTINQNNFDFFTLSNNFSKFGWIYTNLVLVKSSSIEKPDNYSNKQVESILAEIDEEVEEKEEIIPQNLIVVMNESFSDLGIVGELETNEDYMPFIRSLNENTVKGNLHVSTFGGNTYITEYEFLTGNTQHFMPIGSIPYANFSASEKEEEGMAQILQSQGYYTVAMHPYDPSNWNRDKVYATMGFDEFVSIDDYAGSELVRSYVSDKADYEKIIEYYENKDSNQKLFIFNVTMQNHGGYDFSNGTIESTITINNFEDTMGETYLSLIKESDDAFEYLLSYFSDVEEPTMIVMFGDHQPSLPDSFYENLYGKALSQRDIVDVSLQHITPYIIWTNYDSDFEQIPDTSVNYLGRIVLQYAGLDMSEYDRFLLEQAEEIPVIGMYGIYDRNGQFVDYRDMQEGLLDDYETLQYMRLEDRKSKFYDIFSIE